MANLGNQKIKDTYQLVLQTDASGNLQNLSGGTPYPLIFNSGFTSNGDISGTTDLYISQNIYSGTTNLLNIFATSAITNQNVYWSASTGGISNSGLTGNVGIGTSTPNKPLTVSGAISGNSTMAATVYNSTTSSTGYKLNGAKYLWISSGALQVGNDAVDIDIIGTSINLQTATTINDNLTVTGNTNISGSTTYIGAISGTGSVTATAGFVGDVTGDLTGNADTVTNGVYTTNNLSVMADTTSAQLAGVISDESGTGDLLFGTNPIITNPTVHEPNTRFVEPSSSPVGSTGGSDIVVNFGTEGVTIAGNLYVYNTLGGWAPASASAVGTSTGLLGIALGPLSSAGMLIRGMVTTTTFTPSIGLPIYMSATNGLVTVTSPTTSGNIVRVLGYSINTLRCMVWFNPDNTWVQLS